MFDWLQFLFKEFQFNLGKFSVPVPYWEAISIVFLLFLLVIVLASYRKHYVDWSLKGGVAGVFFGFLLALILEGFLLIGGKTAITEVLGWKNPPLPIARVLDSGRAKLIGVLGVNTQIPPSYAKENVNVQNTLDSIQSLNPADLKRVKNLICQP